MAHVPPRIEAPNDHKRAMKRIRRAITELVEWTEIAVMAGGGNPDHVDYKRERAARARSTLERIIAEEL